MIDKYINMNNNLQDLIDSNIFDKKIIKSEIENILGKDSRRFYKDVREYERDLFPNKYNEDRFIAILKGWKYVYGEIVPKNIFDVIKAKAKQEYNENFYTKYDYEIFGVEIDNFIRLGNVIFKNIHGVIKFLIDSGADYFVVDEKFINTLKQKFHWSPNITVRATSATMERTPFIQKVASNTFIPIRVNAKAIADEMVEEIKKIKFRFLPKNLANVILNSIIDKHDLIEDEWYYLLKKYANKRFEFSSGNSMYIAKKGTVEETAPLRFSRYQKKPRIFSAVEMATEIGIEKFGTVNFKFLHSASKDYLFYMDYEDEDHVNYVKNKFKKFRKDYDGLMFTTKEINEFISESNDPFVKTLNKIHNFGTLLKRIYGESFNTDSHGSYSFVSDEKKYINVDDWGGF